MTVSKDGKSMNVVDTDKQTDKQRGGNHDVHGGEAAVGYANRFSADYRKA
jgi:hypothetical protein